MVDIFLDTDVCLDILLLRRPFFKDSFALTSHEKIIDSCKINISEGSIPNLIFFTKEKYKIDNADNRLYDWINSCEVISSNKTVILRSIQSLFKDKEDAYQYFTALQHDMNYFITRNKKDYQPFASAIPVYTPSEFLETIGIND